MTLLTYGLTPIRLSNALQKSSDFVCVFSGDVLCGHSSILPPCHFLCHPMEEGQIKQNTNPSTNQEQDQNGQLISHWTQRRMTFSIFVLFISMSSRETFWETRV